MHIKMMYNITTFIQNLFQYQMENFTKAKTEITFAQTYQQTFRLFSRYF